jgi:uncharacterized phosphosugar-binding protein
MGYFIMKRREFLIGSFLSTVLGHSFISGCSTRQKTFASHSLLYLQKCLEILRNIQNQELPKLIYISIRAAELYRNGGKLISRFTWEHLPLNDIRSDRAGNPGYFVQNGFEENLSPVTELKKGDFFLTNEVSEEVRLAKKEGVYSVGIATPFFPNRFTKPGGIITQPGWSTIEMATHIVLYSFIPDEDGLVAFPQYPMVPLCPGSSLSLLLYYWMISAEVAYQIRAEKTYPFISKARDYIETIIFRLHELDKQLELFEQAAQKMAENILAGSKLYYYDRTGSFTAEAVNRASGLMMARELVPDAVQPNDVVIFGAETADHPDDVELLYQLKERKALIVTIAPLPANHVRNKLKTLNQFAHFGIDNLSGEPGGVVTVIKNEPPICPAGGVMNIIILWALTAQLIGELIRKDLVPYVIMGKHLVGGIEYNLAIQRFFEKRGF